nr:MAG TPA: hypothetical protein [Caudoviricetes sp.]
MPTSIEHAESMAFSIISNSSSEPLTILTLD